MGVSVLFYASSIKVLFVCVRATVLDPSIWSQICFGVGVWCLGEVVPEFSVSTPVGRLAPDMLLKNGAQYVVETKLGVTNIQSEESS